MKDQPELSKLFSQLRQGRRLSLQAVEKQTGISVSTLSRFENNLRTLSFNNLVRINKWLGYDTMSAGVIIARPGATLENIHNAIRMDELLSTENKTSLCHLMTVCYREFVKREKYSRKT